MINLQTITYIQDNSMVGTCNISLEVASPTTVTLGRLPTQLEVDKVIQVIHIMFVFVNR